MMKLKYWFVSVTTEEEESSYNEFTFSKPKVNEFPRSPDTEYEPSDE